MSDDKSWWRKFWDKSDEAEAKTPTWLKVIRAIAQTIVS